MSQVRLQEVAENLSLHCVLCGEVLDLDRFEAHAEAHHEAGECWTWATFAGACEIDPELTGWPVCTADEREGVWPFWLDTALLEAVAMTGKMEAIVA
jgi:hypothetical protein